MPTDFVDNHPGYYDTSQTHIWFGDNDPFHDKYGPSNLFYWRGDMKDAKMVEPAFAIDPAAEKLWEATFIAQELYSMATLVNFKAGQNGYILGRKIGRRDVWVREDVLFIMKDCHPVRASIPFITSDHPNEQSLISVSLTLRFQLKLYPGDGGHEVFLRQNS